ncbi:psychosine receptor [Bombina bombina]|uniref:psychosine receptor n=1 Tax=Bombina bombina TaxID=8345 RepID=UPI00235A9681|nr:psychosine receptor [Bombina bombina]
MIMVNNNSSNCTIIHDIDVYIFPPVYITVIVISLLSNSTSLYVSCVQIKKKNELGIYLFHLSFADLLYTLMLPFWVDFTLNHNHWRFSTVICKINAFFMHINIYSSAGFLTCISLDRYLAVVHPLKFRHLRTRKMAMFVSLAVWIIQSTLNAVILVNEETSRDKDSHLLCFDVFPMTKWQSNFNIMIVCLGHLIPLIIMVICYHKIYSAVKKNQATGDSDKKKIRQLILVILVFFLITLTPYNIVLLIRSIWEPSNCKFAQLMYVPYKVTLALSSINCIADPFLYCFVSEAGRADMMTLLNCCVNQVKANPEYKLATVSVTTSPEKCRAL